jgi:hypothetical protein
LGGWLDRQRRFSPGPKQNPLSAMRFRKVYQALFAEVPETLETELR